jgi:hypothetical protein
MALVFGRSPNGSIADRCPHNPAPIVERGGGRTKLRLRSEMERLGRTRIEASRRLGGSVYARIVIQACVFTTRSRTHASDETKTADASDDR